MGGEKKYSYRPVTPEDAAQIVEWRYPPPYTLYDLNPGAAPWLLSPDTNYYSVVDAAGELTGFFCLGRDARVPGGDYSDKSALDLGLGMRPDLTGQGRGLDFLNALLEFIQQDWSPLRVRLTVATFNQRAVHLYKKAGFRPGRVFLRRSNNESLEFMQMDLEL
ncbi:MAG TPA: GNAT family protein [Chloroflexia bacterium]|nr:GNAT family protein [Chloroflexia bacterium]